MVLQRSKPGYIFRRDKLPSIKQKELPEVAETNGSVATKSKSGPELIKISAVNRQKKSPLISYYSCWFGLVPLRSTPRARSDSAETEHVEVFRIFEGVRILSSFF